MITIYKSIYHRLRKEYKKTAKRYKTKFYEISCQQIRLIAWKRPQSFLDDNRRFKTRGEKSRKSHFNESLGGLFKGVVYE